jgi:PAS domain S-box-containing protein
MIYNEHEVGHARQLESTRLIVMDKLEAIDAQLEKLELLAQAMASNAPTSPHDFALFHQRSARLLLESKLDFCIILYDASGHELLNSGVAYGQPLPTRQTLGHIQSVFQTGHRVRPTVISRTSQGHAIIGGMTPVFSGEKVVYALAVGFSSKILNTLLQPQYLPSGSIATISDSTGTIAASSESAQKLIGQTLDAETLKHLEAQSAGTFDLTISAGTPLRTTYRRSPQSGWSLVIALPLQVIDAPLASNLFILSLGGTLLLALSLFLAWLVARRITSSVETLQSAAVALGAGATIKTPASYFLEAAEASQAMAKSAQLLASRTQELLDSNNALSERTTELAQAQHLAQIGNWRVDLTNQQRFASAEMYELFGPDILLPFSAQSSKLFPPETWKKLDQAIRTSIRTGIGYSLVLEVFNKEGRRIWTDNRCQTVLDASGKVVGLLGTCQDISHLKAIESELRESKTLLRMALTNAELTLWEYHIQSGEILFIERLASLQGLEIPAKPISFESYAKSIFPADVPRMYADLEKYLRGDTKKYEASFRARHVDGHYLWLHSVGKVTDWDSEGKPLRMIGVSIDISERRLSESKMEALHDEMNAMLVWQVAQHTVAALAHEINQPLASASFLCEAASRMLPSSEMPVGDPDKVSDRLAETLQRIGSEIQRAGTVLRSLLASMNKPDLTREPAMVNELIGESIKTAHIEGIFGYPIVTEFAADLPLVKVNLLQFAKVLLNLIHNSAQAMKEAEVSDGKIRISSSLSSDASEVFIHVQDDGPGISALMQQEIFQPFISTKADGLGMGLTISRALIEAHGGKLWATQVEGAGATLHFTLPTGS